MRVNTRKFHGISDNKQKLENFASGLMGAVLTCGVLTCGVLTCGVLTWGVPTWGLARGLMGAVRLLVSKQARRATLRRASMATRIAVSATSDSSTTSTCTYYDTRRRLPPF